VLVIAELREAAFAGRGHGRNRSHRELLESINGAFELRVDLPEPCPHLLDRCGHLGLDFLGSGRLSATESATASSALLLLSFLVLLRWSILLHPSRFYGCASSKGRHGRNWWMVIYISCSVIDQDGYMGRRRRSSRLPS
jgi:hypothetical protein